MPQHIWLPGSEDISGLSFDVSRSLEGRFKVTQILKMYFDQIFRISEEKKKQ